MKPEEVLTQFMIKMCQWERDLIKNDAGTQHAYFEANKAALRESLTNIYAEFLTPKERKNGRIASIHFGTPLEFDPANERIVSTEIVTADKKVVIETVYSTYMKLQRRYTLVFTKGHWRIEKREDYSADRKSVV